MNNKKTKDKGNKWSLVLHSTVEADGDFLSLVLESRACVNSLRTEVSKLSAIFGFAILGQDLRRQ